MGGGGFAGRGLGGGGLGGGDGSAFKAAVREVTSDPFCAAAASCVATATAAALAAALTFAPEGKSCSVMTAPVCAGATPTKFAPSNASVAAVLAFASRLLCTCADMAEAVLNAAAVAPKPHSVRVTFVAGLVCRRRRRNAPDGTARAT